jgi:hyaluronan synthase
VLVPIAFAWLLAVLKPLRLWGMSTCWRTGWGTRAKVEVGLSAARTPSADAEAA